MTWFLLLVVSALIGFGIGKKSAGVPFSWRKALIAFVVAFVVAGGVAWVKNSSAPSPTPSFDVKTATYTVDGKTTTLSGQTAYFGNQATGDLDSNSASDTAFIITQQPGGSGTFYYVVAALGTSGGWVGTNAVLLGDRIAPQTTQIKDGVVIVNYADRKSGEPFTTQPSVGKTAYFHIENGKLVEMTAPK